MSASSPAIRTPINGFLFINQPRLGVKPPNRTDHDYRATLLDKLNQAFTLAAEQQLQMVFTGSLFEKAKESDHRLLAGLFQLLVEAEHKPIFLANSIELNASDELITDTTLGVIHSTGLIKVITKNGLFDHFLLNNQKCALGGTPYGLPINANQQGLQENKQEKVIWLMNDLMLPGWEKKDESLCFAGIDMVINACSTEPLTSIQHQNTLHYFPGSMTRILPSEESYLPTIYSWDGQNFNSHPLNAIKNVFATIAEPEKITTLPTSAFVELLKQDAIEEPDAVTNLPLKADLDEVIEELELGEEVELLMNDLLNRSVMM